MLTGFLSPLLVLVLAGLTSPAVGADADPVAQDTRELFDKAATEYETSDYNGAVDTYTEAYSRSFSIEDEALRGRVQAAILFNLARAHSKAYALDQSAEHLRQTVDLLGKYLEQTADLQDKQDAEQLLDEAEFELERLERESQREGRNNPVPPLGQKDTSSKPGAMEITGFTFIGLGVVGGGVAIAGAVLSQQATKDHEAGPTLEDRNSAETQGKRANTLIVAGAVSAGLLIGAGAVLAAAGRKKRTRVSPSAWLTPQGAGLSVHGSF